MEKLLVIDGNSMINRAFYGIRALSTSDGRPTNAIYGLINIVRGQLERLAPDYACIAFDVHVPNFRKKIYPQYKEGRHPTPPDLLAQFEDAKDCMRLMGLHVIELPGYEADDVLGTVASCAAKNGIDAYILTGDRDLLQMIGQDITVLLATNSDTVVFDTAHFRETYGIEPSQFIDVKALMGDSSDNIPGVAGIGEKTAFRLISHFQSLDRIYENLEHPSIKRGIRDKLEQGKSQAYLAKELVTVLRNAPICDTLPDMRYTGNAEGLREKLLSLEFHNLIRKLGLNEARITPTFQEKEQEAAVSVEELSALSPWSPLALFLSEDGLHVYAESIGARLYTGRLAPLAPLFDGSLQIITFDAKTLLHALYRENVYPSCTMRDLMLYAYLLHPNGSSKTMADILSLAFTDCLTPIPSSPAQQLWLAEPLLSKSIDEAGMSTILNEVELPLINVLASMEAYGCKIHRRGLTAFGEELDNTILALTESIYEAAGKEFNINSTKQLADILYNVLALPTAKHTKNGYSTDVETLEKLRPYHPIVSLVLDYRQVTKLRSTYVTALLRVADENDRIHTDFKQALTATGRLSSADPNLQNIPIRTELGKEMRRFFIAGDDDRVLIDADYSQIELRLLAHIAQDQTMADAFRHHTDIHTRTASLVFGVSEEEVTSELRLRAKAVNFGIIYGIGAFSLSRDLGITAAQAKRYIESYLDTYPAIRAYMTNVVENARKDGYTTTLFGRRRYIPELRAANKNLQAFGSRVAMNSPIQGSAADLMKIAMLRVARRLAKECPEAHLIMQVHDELIVESPRSLSKKAAAILKEEMESAADLSVPLVVDMQIADDWLGE